MSDTFDEGGKLELPKCRGRRPHLRDFEEDCDPFDSGQHVMHAGKSEGLCALNVELHEQSVNASAAISTFGADDRSTFTRSAA